MEGKKGGCLWLLIECSLEPIHLNQAFLYALSLAINLNLKHMDLNRATILGRITQDPEVRTTNTGKSVASFGVATNRSWTDQSGTKQEFTEFHNCVLWGRLAEIAGQYLTKGQRVYMEGRLQTRDWTGQDGVKRYRTEIVVENMIMLEKPRGTSAPAASDDAPPPPSDSGAPADEVVEEEVKVEDIPF